MFKVSTDEEVLYRGWCQKEALSVLTGCALTGKANAKLEVVDNVPTGHNPEDEDAAIFEQIRECWGETEESLTNVVSMLSDSGVAKKLSDTLGVAKKSVEDFLTCVQNDGDRAAKVVKSCLDEGGTIIGDALTRLGNVVKRANEKTDTD